MQPHLYISGFPISSQLGCSVTRHLRVGNSTSCKTGRILLNKRVQKYRVLLPLCSMSASIGSRSFDVNWCYLVSGIRVQDHISRFVFDRLVFGVVLVPRWIVFNRNLFHLPVKLAEAKLGEKAPHLAVILLRCRHISFTPRFRSSTILRKLCPNGPSNPAYLRCSMAVDRLAILILDEKHRDVLAL